MVSIRLRTRTDHDSGTFDRWFYENGWTGPFTRIHSWQSLDSAVHDVSGAFEQVNPFLLEKKWNNVAPFSAYRNDWTTGHIVWQATQVDPGWPFPNNFPLSLKDIGPNELAARTNPSKPAVNLPLFLFELKDVPGMLSQVSSFAKSLPLTIELIKTRGFNLMAKGRQKKIVQGLGEFNLAVGFGWAPLLEDLVTMIGLSDAVQRRMRDLSSTKSPRGLRKTVKIDSASSHEDTGSVYSANLDNEATIIARHVTTKKSRRWATAVWKENGGIMPPIDDTYVGALKSLLGLSVEASTIWEAIPWSFLVDYFFGVGTMLEARRNSVQHDCIRMALMTETITTKVTTIDAVYNVHGWSGGSGSMNAIRKERTPLVGSLVPAFTPFLSERQVSNLASLSVARRNNPW